MRALMSGWALLGAVLLGLVAVGGVMLTAEPPARPDPALRGIHSQMAAARAADGAPLASATPSASASPSAAASPRDERFVIKRILPIQGAIRYGEWHWDETGVPAGPIVITVDLDARVISIFRGGYEIGAAAVLLGTQEKPTPLGIFPIMQKKRHHVSNLYNAPMPFMQRLTNDGVALHASNVERGYASHGCVGMPPEFAEKVFGATKVGDKVYITRGKQVGMGDSLTEG